MARPKNKALVLGGAAVVLAAAIGYFVISLVDAGKPPGWRHLRPAATSANPAQPARPKPPPPSGPNQAG